MNTSLKKTLGTALTALALCAAPVHAEPFAPAPDAQAQLDVMAASGVIEEEIYSLYRSWQVIMRNNQQDRSMEYLYAAVTDLDRNGRLELLISSHLINKDLLVFAGEDISEELKERLTLFCNSNLSRAFGKAYEISEDRTTLVPIEIECDREHFPDLTRIMITPHQVDRRFIYDVDTSLMPRRTWDSIEPPFSVAVDYQTICLEAGKLRCTTEARLEGEAGINSEEEYPYTHWNVLKLYGAGKEVAPFGSEAAEFERGRNIYSPCVHAVDFKALHHDTRAALAASWYGWTYID